jgi:L-lactate dehydrogenase complex protein LldG
LVERRRKRPVSAREEVLNRIRSALDGTSRGVPVPRDYSAASGAPGDVDLLVERLEDYRALVSRTTLNDLPRTLVEVLLGEGVRSLVIPRGLPHSWLRELPPSIAAVTTDDLPVSALATADAVLTGCALAVAETGTIVLDHGPGQGRRALTLVPDVHVVVLVADQVVPGVSDAVAVLEPTLPMTWISGPSATSDIELNRVEGVHGPRRLRVVLVVPDP